MFLALLQAIIVKRHRSLRTGNTGGLHRHTLFAFMTILIIGSVQLSSPLYAAHAAQASRDYPCSWYQIQPGDTLSTIAETSGTNMWVLAQLNNIVQVNLIYAGRNLCIPQSAANSLAAQNIGIGRDGSVRWYAYDALEESNYYQAITLLHRAAAYYNVPPNLLLAIAWQESNWRQHVISPDGGIGMMQIMPYTATWINTITGVQHDPYKLTDNIFLGAFYLHTLLNTFHGNMQQVVSAYNEGDWAVTHKGIMNWQYVNNVLSMTQNMS